MLRPATCSTLFPYTTLFRSAGDLRRPDQAGPGLSSALAGAAPPAGPRGVPGRRLLPALAPARARVQALGRAGRRLRSEEHTSELQSRLHLVCRLLLEKKKTN